MKLKKLLLTSLCVCSLSLVMVTSLSACDDEDETNDVIFEPSKEDEKMLETGTTGLGYTYYESTNSYGVSGYIGVDEKVYIPYTWNDLPVDRICSNAFSSARVSISEVVVASSVYSVSTNAFSRSSYSSSWFSTSFTVTFYAPTIYIASSAFYNVNNTALSVRFYGNKVIFDGHSFSYCQGSTLSILLPKNVTTNDYDSFVYESGTPSIFYYGTYQDKTEYAPYIDLSGSVYYYTKTTKGVYDPGRCWHFVDREPVIWD